MLLELEFKKNNYLFQHRIPIEIFSFEFWMFCKTDSADDNPGCVCIRMFIRTINTTLGPRLGRTPPSKNFNLLIIIYTPFA